MSHLVSACGCNMISRFHQLQLAEAITHTEQLSSLPSAERTRGGGGGGGPGEAGHLTTYLLDVLYLPPGQAQVATSPSSSIRFIAIILWSEGPAIYANVCELSHATMDSESKSIGK